MALATFTVNLNGGDETTLDTNLTYKVYGSADGYTTAIATLGSATSDPNVSVNAGVATLSNVDVGTETTFKVTTIDESLNESDQSNIFVNPNANYYVSTSGTGTGDGSIGDPLDFTQLQALTPVAGDTIALKGGDEFYGGLSVGVSGTLGNPITFTSYGNGQAIFKGTEELTGWSALSGEGPELITNGDFSGGTTGWTFNLGSWTVGSGVATYDAVNAGDFIQQTGILTIGETYTVRFDVSGSSAIFRISVDGGSPVYVNETGGDGAYEYTINSAASTDFYIRGSNFSGGEPFSIDNVSVVLAGATVPNVYEASTVGKNVNGLLKSGVSLQTATIPAISDYTAVRDELYSVTSVSSQTVFICEALIGAGDITGATIQISAAKWSLDAKTITAFNNTTGEVTIDSSINSYTISSGDLFCVMNHELFMAKNGDWWYDSANDKVYLYDSTGTPTGISLMSENGNAFTVNANYTTIDNIKFKGYHAEAIDYDWNVVGNNVVQNCTFEDNHNYSISSWAGTSLTCTNNTLERCWGGLQMYDGAFTATGNTFTEMGTIKYMSFKSNENFFHHFPNCIYHAKGNSGTDVTLVSENNFYNLGYVGTYVNGVNTTVSKNYFENVCMYGDDGGGVYTSQDQTGMIIENNIVVNNYLSGWVEGIYLDEAAQGITVRNNTAVGNFRSGFYVHNGNSNTIENNVAYGTFDTACYYVGSDNANPITNNSFSYNQGYTEGFGFTFAVYNFFNTLYDFGTSDNNKYMKPASSNMFHLWLSTEVPYPTLSGIYDLATWTTLTGQESNSERIIANASTSYVAYNETGTAKDIALPAGTWSTLAGDHYSGTINIPAYSSEILTLVPIDWYISKSGDNTDGLTEATAYNDFATLDLNETLVAGETVGFDAQDEFYENISISNLNGTLGNPITFTSYGTGKATIKGSEAITGWTNTSGNIWEADVTGKTIYSILKAGVQTRMASYPAYDEYGTVNNYMNVDGSTGETNLQSNALNGFADLVGAEVYCLTTNYVLRHETVSTFVSGTGTITLDTSMTGLGTGDKFFVTNHYNLLTAEDDWHYDSGTNKLYVYTTDVGGPTNIEAITSLNDGIYLDTCDFINIDNLNINNHGQRGVHSYLSTDVNITNCNIKYNQWEGVRADATITFGDRNHVRNNHIIGGWYGIFAGVRGSEITDNIVEEIGSIKHIALSEPVGLGRVGILSGSRSNVLISGNQVLKSGYLGIRSFGENDTIEKNLVQDYCLHLHDGGGIYAWNPDFTGIAGNGLTIDSNIILQENITNNNQGWYDYGIYMDDYTDDIVVSNNSVSTSGIPYFLHNSRNITTSGNYFINNQTHDRATITVENVTGNMINNTFTNNYFYINSNWVLMVEPRSTADNNFDYGTWNNNVYANPQFTDIIRLNRPSGTTDYTLAEWQVATSQDANSSYVQPSTQNTEFVYNYSNAAADIALPAGTWYDSDGGEHTGTITLGAYSSEILYDTLVVAPPLPLIDDFTTDSGYWTDITIGTGTVVIGGGVMTFDRPVDGTSDPRVEHLSEMVGGVTYTVSFDIISKTNTPQNIELSTSGDGLTYELVVVGANSIDYTPTNGGKIRLGLPGAAPRNFVIDNLDIRVKP